MPFVSIQWIPLSIDELGVEVYTEFIGLLCGVSERTRREENEEWVCSWAGKLVEILKIPLGLLLSMFVHRVQELCVWVRFFFLSFSLSKTRNNLRLCAETEWVCGGAGIVQLVWVSSSNKESFMYLVTCSQLNYPRAWEQCDKCKILSRCKSNVKLFAASFRRLLYVRMGFSILERIVYMCVLCCGMRVCAATIESVLLTVNIISEIFRSR